MKNRHILIIAANAREGGKYAKYADLPNFTYRVVRAASTITGIQSVDVHLVDGFEKRPDAGAILGRLRWARDIAYYSVSMPPIPPKEVEGQLELPFDQGGHFPGWKVDEIPVEAVPFAGVQESTSEEPAAESLAHVDEAPAETAVEQAPRKRRKRCKVCGRLTHLPFDEDREGHDEKAHASQSLFA